MSEMEPEKSTRKKGLLTGSLVLFFVAGSVVYAIPEKLVPTFFLASTTTLEAQKNDLKLLIVEFGSRAPIPNKQVVITEQETGIVLDSVQGNAKGEVVLKGLTPGMNYIIKAIDPSDSLQDIQNQTGQKMSYKKGQEYVVFETYMAGDEQHLSVPVVMQNPELPHGCEITSLTAVLNYFRFQVTKTDMAQNFLPKQEFKIKNGKKVGPNPHEAFGGDPADLENGMYVFAEPIVKAAKQVAKEQQIPLQVYNVSGQSKETLLEYVKKGIPVVVWVTLDLSKPRTYGSWIIEGTNTKHDAFVNLHAVVLTGYEDGQVFVMDPLHGYLSHDEELFFTSYKELGSQAIAIQR